jgi:thiol-disulfide isomerase/thioredoxin
MNKYLKHLLCGALAVGFLASCNQNSKTFTIEGTVDEGITDTAYFVYIGDSNFNIGLDRLCDTIIVKDKKFSYSVDWDYPTWIYLQAIFKDGSVCNAVVNFVLVPGEKAKLKVCNGFYELNGASGFYQQWGNYTKFKNENEYTKERDELYSQYRENNELQKDTNWVNAYMNAVENIGKSTEEYITAHNNEEAPFVYELLIGGGFSIDKLLDTLAAPEFKNGRFKTLVDLCVENQKQMKEYMAQLAEKQKATAVGSMFKDFAAEYNGKTTKLSDFVGKGKYVLVDFWASWCGPCRAEIPNLVKVYDSYKNKNVNVLGVTVGDRPEDSEQAMKDLGVNYPQILNTPDSCADLYGINGIPHIILFGPDGTILERDLRGEEIENALRKYLGL